MKFIFFILLIFSSNLLFAKNVESSEIEVINLHETKSLDQMVLDNLNSDDEIEEVIEDISDNNEKENDLVEVNQDEIENNNFIYTNNTKDLKNYFKYLKNISSKTLQKEIIEVLQNLELNLENDQENEIFFLIADYFKSIGQIKYMC